MDGFRHRQDFMRTSHIITGVALIAALVVGCSKSPVGSSPTVATDLELSTKSPTHVTIDSSHDCTITTTTIPGGQLMLRLDYKSADSGKPTPPVKLIVSPGQEFTVQTEGMAAPLRFKAKLKAE
jgi:hypothetical protein